MDDRADIVRLQQLQHGGFITYIAAREGQRPPGNFPHPFQGEFTAIAKIVEHHHLVALFQ